MEENITWAMIMLSSINYALWKSQMEDILFCKDLYNPLENKRAKPVTTKDEEWKKMNQKIIGR